VLEWLEMDVDRQRLHQRLVVLLVVLFLSKLLACPVRAQMLRWLLLEQDRR